MVAFRLLLLVCFVSLPLLAAADTPPPGQRVFTCAHSFHYFVPPILADIAIKAGIKGHQQVGLSAIGGSRIYQHWNVAEDKNKAKAALKEGKVDVLTLSPIEVADDGIEKFASLAHKHNPKVRVLVQQNWAPFDAFDGVKKMAATKVDRDAVNAEQVKALHAPYFKNVEDSIKALNTKLGGEFVYVVPVGSAVVALRQKVLEGKVPNVKKQSELFTDPIGHATPTVMVLEGYVYYAAIYGKSPVGIPMPGVLKKVKGTDKDLETLNTLLQELAWEAVKDMPVVKKK